MGATMFSLYVSLNVLQSFYSAFFFFLDILSVTTSHLFSSAAATVTSERERKVQANQRKSMDMQREVTKKLITTVHTVVRFFLRRVTEFENPRKTGTCLRRFFGLMIHLFYQVAYFYS